MVFEPDRIEALLGARCAAVKCGCGRWSLRAKSVIFILL